MLPKRLELKNFLAYRSPDALNLSDLHLACLSGMNGAGKSSLLDAITWALWGKARSHSDDDLIHIGQSEMQVTLDFLQGQQLYRVIRKRKSGGKQLGRSVGQSELNLFAWDDQKQIYHLISEPSIKETQARINHLLKLDYPMFVSSAFLQQGKADAFTGQKTPAERKKLLYDILGLERWTLYEDKAKALLDDIQFNTKLIDQSLREIEEEIREEPALERELTLAQQSLVEAENEVTDAEFALDEVRGADTELRSAQEILIGLQQNMTERQQDIQQTQRDIEDNLQRIADFESVMGQAEQIKAGYAELEAARAADMALGDKLGQLNDLNQQSAMLEKQLDQARQTLELEARQLETLISQDSQLAETEGVLQESLRELAAEIRTLETVETQREAQRQTIDQWQQDRSALKALNDTIHQEAEGIKERITLLQKTKTALCPVCGQPLTEEQRHNLIGELESDVENRRDLYRQHQARQKEMDNEIKYLQGEIALAGNQLKELPRLRGQQGGLDQQVKSASQAADRLQNNQLKLNSIVSLIQTDQFGEAIRAQLVEVESQRQTLDYDPSQHKAIRSTLETHLSFQSQAQALEVALQTLPTLQQSLQNAQGRLERYEKSLADYTLQAEAQTQEMERLQVKVGVMRQRQEFLNEKRTYQRQAQERVIFLEQRLHTIVSQKRRRTDLTQRREELIYQETVYDQLKMAFGRNGIPAMLIEAAIPELEDAANRLLARMTNHRMNISLITQKDKKAGGVTETLDILVSDELGTRPYGLFSGGEAFRVDFAIRVALSQLLARRAGAQLRTLFIDEGFGTQDEMGRERLIEAITSIQDDFDLILVITHIEDLRDAFPAHIEVSKTAEGSRAVIR